MNSLAELRNMLATLNLPLQADEDTSILSKPVRVGSFTTPNALAVQPMEGCDGDSEGRPGSLTLRRYERFAAGGSGLLWFEAIAVVPEGRANPRQLWLHKASRDSFAEMVDMTRRIARERFGENHRPLLVAQLTHSGRYSRPIAKPHPLIPQRDPYRDAKINLTKDWPVVDDDYLDRLQDSYLDAVRLAFEVGFDAVDIKSCHGYLINELFACHGRPGKYGGSFENRTRFLLSIIDRIRQTFGNERMIATRLGIFDAIPYPFGWGVDKTDPTKPDLTEPKRLIGELEKRGVKLINITIANPYYNPHYGRPFNEPVVGGYEAPEHPLVGVERIVRLAGEVQQAYPKIAMVGTGYSWLRTWFPHVAAATLRQGKAAFIGGGRMAFAYPDFAKTIASGKPLDPNKVCVACSACTQIMRDGGRSGCVVRDNAVYGPIFEYGRMSNRDNLARLAKSCRQCEIPSCQLNCPAGVNIPAFIKAFLDGDDRAAYEEIRRANVLPEVCAWLCPVEQQCEGNCLEKFIGGKSLPIADIQRFLAAQANRNGWSKLRIPSKATGKSVAVIGAGPAGLACAAQLVEKGHSVVVFDSHQSLGGLVKSVIPEERQSNALRNELNAIFANAPESSLQFRFGQRLDAQKNLDSILAENFDAAFIGMGLARAASALPGTKPTGVFSAMEFLASAKSTATAHSLPLQGKAVAVIGGGNTAMDAAVTAKQLGARDVYLIYRRSFAEMPAWTAERDRALNGGVHFLILTLQLEYVARNGKMAALKVCPTQLGEPDASGRRSPRALKENSYDLPVDMVVEAIGQESAPDLAATLPGIDVIKGLIQTRTGSHLTSRANVFAGGDIVHGASTVVAAVADGMKAAEEIDALLQSYNSKGK